MDDLRFYILFNSISVISGRWVDNNERLCAMEPGLRLRRFRLKRGLNLGLLDHRPVLNTLSYQGSYHRAKHDLTQCMKDSKNFE